MKEALKTMSFDQRKPNTVLHGTIFPESVQVLVVIPMGNAVKLVDKGVQSAKIYEPILSTEKAVLLETTPDTDPLRRRPRNAVRHESELMSKTINNPSNGFGNPSNNRFDGAPETLPPRPATTSWKSPRGPAPDPLLLLGHRSFPPRLGKFSDVQPINHAPRGGYEPLPRTVQDRESQINLPWR